MLPCGELPDGSPLQHPDPCVNRVFFPLENWVRRAAMRIPILLLIGVLAACSWAGSSAFAQGFGKLTGQFRYGPKFVQPAGLPIAAPCVAPVSDEELVVGPKGELANVVVSLFLKLDEKP